MNAFYHFSSFTFSNISSLEVIIISWVIWNENTTWVFLHVENAWHDRVPNCYLLCMTLNRCLSKPVSDNFSLVFFLHPLSCCRYFYCIFLFCFNSWLFSGPFAESFHHALHASRPWNKKNLFIVFHKRYINSRKKITRKEITI